MSLNQRKGLRDLLAGRNQGSISKEVPKSQTPPNLPSPPPPPTTNLSLLPISNLKKKRKDQELEKGEVVPQKGGKTTKNGQGPQIQKVHLHGQPGGAQWGRGATSATHLVSSAGSGWRCHPLELLHQGVSERAFFHIVEALEQSLLLPKDMDALRLHKHLFKKSIYIHI